MTREKKSVCGSCLYNGPLIIPILLKYTTGVIAKQQHLTKKDKTNETK